MSPMAELHARVRSLPGWVGDAALAVALAAVELSYQHVVDPSAIPELDPFRGGTPVGVVVGLTAALPLALRRRTPELTMAVIGLTAVAAIPLGVPLTGFSLILALYTVAAYCRRRDSLVILGIFAFFTAVALMLADTLRFAPVNAVIFLTAWVFGDRQQARRAYTVELERRAEQAEREREDKAQLAVAGERARIARELHDIVAHSVSVMVVQAAGARRLLEQAPERAAEALEHVESTGRQSLVELRRVLGVLRDPAQVPALVPQPRLEHLDMLVARFREAGLPVEVTIEGQVRELSSGVELSAFRIVQEALTNALRHADAAQVWLRVRYGDEELEIEVLDDGRAAHTTNGEGQGLVGMRERAALLGGHVHAGPRPQGGFGVQASLPVEASA